MLFGVDLVFGLVCVFEDGMSVISVMPMSLVAVFNFAFDRQATIMVNGVELESFYFGFYVEMLLDDEMFYLLLCFFL